VVFSIKIIKNYIYDWFLLLKNCVFVRWSFWRKTIYLFASNCNERVTPYSFEVYSKCIWFYPVTYFIVCPARERVDSAQPPASPSCYQNWFANGWVSLKNEQKNWFCAFSRWTKYRWFCIANRGMFSFWTVRVSAASEWPCIASRRTKNTFDFTLIII
jgi:hypothetical protein